MNAIRKEAVIEAIIQSLCDGCTRTAAVEAAGISRTCFYEWCKDDAPLAERAAEAEASAVKAVEGALYKSATMPDDKGKYQTVAQIFYLCNKAPEDWKNVKDHRVSGAVDIRLALLDHIEGVEGYSADGTPETDNS